MTSKRSVVVTGLGVVCANGIGMDTVWSRCSSGHNAIHEITHFDASRYKCRVGGEVSGFDAKPYVNGQILQQTDRSTHMAMAASKMAADDARLDLKKEDPNDVGMYFSNLLGGMHFAEPELYAQAFLGPSRVNAYQAIAWFYAATQGQWSIQNGIKGYGKTIVADRTGGLQSVGLAAHAIHRGHCRVAFAGGFEAPLISYAFLMYQTTGLLSESTTIPMLAYRPFHRWRSGLVLGEGSGILILEDLEHALARNAPIYAKISGFSVAMDSPKEPPGSGLARSFSEALQFAKLKPGDIDHISAEGVATSADDAAEAAAIRQVFGSNSNNITVSSPKSMFGHTLGAAGAIDAALACRMIQNNAVLPTGSLDEPDPNLGLAHLNNRVQHKSVNAVMCSSRGHGGLSTALLLQRN